MTVRIQWRVISRGQARSMEGRFTIEQQDDQLWICTDHTKNRSTRGMLTTCKVWARDIVEEELEDLKQ